MPTPIPEDARFALFSTTIARCGIAWTGSTILATHPPETTDEATYRRLVQYSGESSERARFGDSPGLFHDLPLAVKRKG